jgi:TRAP-type C4-dicarboxylate transport system permease large subunit
MVTSGLLPAWRSHRSACKLAQKRISREDIIKGVRPFMAARLIVLLLLILFPALVTVPAKWFTG